VTCHDAARVIDAYIDDELTALDASAVSAHVEACPACAQSVADRQALGRLIRGVPYYVAPNAVRARVVAKSDRSRRRTQTLAWAAGILLAASLGVTAAHTLGLYRTTETVAQNVVENHVQALREQRLVDVRSSDQHTVKPWFLGKLDYAPTVDDLASAGFPLAGGRVDQIGGRTVAVLIYQRRQHPIAVFVWPEKDTRTLASDSQTVQGFHVRHWTANGMSFWAVSDLNVAELDEFAKRLAR
jgi:anti-sigma factor RsiW